MTSSSATRADNLLGYPVGAAYLNEASTMMETAILPAAGQPTFDAHYLATMRDASTRLASQGARVLWVTPPCFGTHPGDDSTPQSPWYDPQRVTALGRTRPDLFRQEIEDESIEQIGPHQ